MIRVCLYTDQYRDVWEKYIRNHPHANIGHRIGWKSVMERAFKREHRNLIALDNDEIKGVLPLILVKTWWGNKALFSMPWVDYGGVCADDDQTAILLTEEAKKICRDENFDFVELRLSQELSVEMPIRTDKVTFLLDLEQGAESIFKDYFDAKLRNQIRKPDKSGLITEYAGVEGLDDFYRVFSINMRRLGTPVWAKECFRAVLEEFPESSRLILVKKDQATVAGGVVLEFKDRTYIPWASALKKYIRLCPNHAMYWRVIKDSCEKEFKYFDFGRSTVNCGTYRFKNQWVKDPSQLTWKYYLNKVKEVPRLTSNNPQFKILINLWKRMPLWLTNLIGPKINRNLP
jgi:FemAB-related protein (PEP-CTERM system-associated)